MFISHEKGDGGLAREIRDHLVAGGYSCWMAPDDIRGLTPWPEQIVRAIDSCDVMLVVVSSRANGSPHVSREVDLALEKGKPLLPVRVEDIVPSGSLDYLLRLTQWIDVFPGSLADHAGSLQDMIGSMLAERGLAVPEPVLPPTSEPEPRRRPRRRLPGPVLVAGAGLLIVLFGAVALVAALRGGDDPSNELDDPMAQAGDEPSTQADDPVAQSGDEPSTQTDDPIPDVDDAPGQYALISVASDGSEGNGHSVNPSVSDDGRFVAFDSAASNLVEGDTGRFRDVFVHDRETGETTRISQIVFGERVEEGNVGSSHPTISGNGRYVVYPSGASNLDPDRDQATNLYLYDRELGRNRQVGFDQGGGEHPQEPLHADISDDGTVIAYATYPRGQLPAEGVPAVALDERGTNYDVWVYDTTSGTTTMMASFDLSVGGIAVTHGPKVTPDGAFVWVNGGAGGGTFLFERATGTAIDLEMDFEVDYLIPFPDGDRIAFTSGSALVPDDVNGMDDLYVHDRSTGRFRLLAEFGPDWSGRPSSISADGRHLAVASPGSAPRIIDTTSGETVAELDASLGLGALEISGGSGWLAFSTSAALVGSDMDFMEDVFVVELAENDVHTSATDDGSITRASISSDGSQGEALSGNSSISADGRYVAFDSLATLVEPDRGGHHDVFVHDRLTGETISASQVIRDDGVIEEANAASFHPQISGDGQLVVFVSSATNLNAQLPDTNGASDIFLYRQDSPGQVELISLTPDGGQHAANSIDPSMSGDGSLIAYATYIGGDRPEPGQGVGLYTAWIYDKNRGTTTRLAEFDTSNPGIDLSPPVVARSGTIAVVSGLHGGVFVYETTTGDVAEITDLRSTAWPVVWAEGQSIYFTSCDDILLSVSGADPDACDIFAWDTDAEDTPRLLLDLDRHFRVAAVTTDERFVLVAGQEEEQGGGGLVLDLADGSIVDLTFDQRSHGFDLSDDGRYATFSSRSPLTEGDTNGVSDVFVVELRD